MAVLRRSVAVKIPCKDGTAGRTEAKLNAALSYAGRGFAMIPLAPNEKHPYWELLPRDRKGKPTWKPLAKKPATKAQIRKWFTIDPDCNLGIITGEASGNLVVVDFDRPPSPGQYHIPPTPQVNTKRGFHAYFRSKSVVKGRKFPHGEIKADGGYVVAPPSIHPDGIMYEWCEFLTLEDVQIADLPSCFLCVNDATPRALSHSAKTTRRTNLSAISNSSRAAVKPIKPVKGNQLQAWYMSEEVGLRVAAFLKIPTDRIGKAFPCILPGHSEKRPSASLYVHPKTGEVRYRDWHARDGNEWYSLADVRAAIAYGEIKLLNKPERATWQLRLLVEAGFLQPAEVPLPPLPAKAGVTTRKVYDGFRLLLGCKWLHSPGKPTAFSWRFAGAWCDVGERQAGEAIKEMLRLDIIRAEKRIGKMWLFSPGDPGENRGPRRGSK